MTTINEPVTLPRDKIDTTALALFGAMFLGLALIGGSSLWAPVSNAFQQVTQNSGSDSTSAIEIEQRRQKDEIRKLGRGLIKLAIEQDQQSLAGGNTSAIAAEQRRQADTINKLGRGLIKIGVEQDTMTRQVDHYDSAVNYRFSQLEAEISALESKVRSNNTAGAWAEAVGQLGVVAAHTRTDIYGLRSSLDEHVQAFRKEIDTITTRLDSVEQQASQNHRVDALAARLDQLEQQLLSRDLTSSIRPPARKKVMKRKPRAIKSARVESHAANPQTIFPQHQFRPASGSAVLPQ